MTEAEHTPRLLSKAASNSTPVELARRQLLNLSELNVLVREPIRIAGVADGPLSGTPIVVKANIAIEGLPFCGGSPALDDVSAETSATAVERLLSAGAVIVGQTNLHELAFGITSANAYHGPVKNPRDHSRIAGGSSGGTAAAIAGDAVTMGLGTDTGGSGRLPAALCGCVGLRPSTGRYPADGVLNLSSSFDTISVMGRTCEDVAKLDAVVAGEVDPLPVLSAADVRLGVSREPFWSGISEEMLELCNQRLDELAAAGIALIEVAAKDILEPSQEIASPIVFAETKAFWEPFLKDKLDCTLSEFVSEIASLDVASIFQAIADGAGPDDASYFQMLNKTRPAIETALEHVLEAHNLDGLIFPTSPIFAPLLTETETVELNGQEKPLFEAMTRRENLASVTGLPAISVPAGLNDGGLPYGLEIIGRKKQDRRLIAIAQSVEACLGRPLEVAE